jgi:hypothetical protein
MAPQNRNVFAALGGGPKAPPSPAPPPRSTSNAPGVPGGGEKKKIGRGFDF